MKKQYLVAALLVVFGFSTQAQAGWGILGGINDASPSVTIPGATATVASKIGVAGGLSYEHSLGKVGLEIDGLYVQSKFDITAAVGAASVTNAIEAKSLQFPVLVRFKISPMFDLGAGGFYQMALGDLTNNGASVTYEAQGVKKSDFGLVGSVRFKLNAGAAKFVIDGRYVYGLTEQSTNTATETDKNRAIQGFVGLAWNI